MINFIKWLFHIHTWTKWHQTGNLVENFGSDIFRIGITMQKECEKCGLIKRKSAYN